MLGTGTDAAPAPSYLAYMMMVDGARAEAMAEGLLEMGAASATCEPGVVDAGRGGGLFRAGSLAGERAFYYVPDRGGDATAVAREDAMAKWERVQVTALFKAGNEDAAAFAIDAAAKMAGLQGAKEGAAAEGDGVVAYVVADDVLDDSWMTRLVGSLGPMAIDEHTTVVPVGSDGPTGEGEDVAGSSAAATTLYVEPGFAFGTGDHPTTALCLRAIRRHVADAPRDAPLHVLDYGAGTGLLGIAALVMHRAHAPAAARRAVMLDIDPNAVVACATTASLNRVDPAETAAALCSEAGDVDANDPAHAWIAEDGRFDLVVANVLLPPLLELVAYLSSRVKPGGILVLSGVLAGEQVARVSEAYTASGALELVRVDEDDDGADTQGGQRPAPTRWAAVTLRRST